MRLLHNVRTLLCILFGALLMFAVAACTDSGPANPPKSDDDARETKPQPRENRVQPTPDTLVTTLPTNADADGDWGTIKGQVVFGGPKAPVPAVMKVDKDEKACLETKKQLTSEDWVMDPDTKGLKWAIVWLIPNSTKKEDLTKPIPIHPERKKQMEEDRKKNVVIDQPCCMFEPYCIALQEGQSITIKNSMGISHNSKVDGDSDVNNPQVNPLIPAGAKVDVGPFHPQWTEIPLSCSIHAWMSGHIRVFSHPYYVVTGKDGKFEIKDAPAGKYRLVIWHPGGLYITHEKGKDPDKFGMPIEIKGGATTDLGQFKVMVPKG
jgi:hypothetical protein